MGGILYRRGAVFLSERIEANHAADPAVLPKRATCASCTWARGEHGCCPGRPVHFGHQAGTTGVLLMLS